MRVHRTRLIALVLAAGLVLAACGDKKNDDTSSSSKTTAAPPTSAEETTTTAPAGPVKTTKAIVGDILVDDKGMTLYGFTNDKDGKSACYEGCATAWPPLTVDGTELPAGLDAKVFSLVKRDDGKMQLKAGDWPLYYFANDKKAGDANGQGVGDIWWVVAPDGTLIMKK